MIDSEWCWMETKLKHFLVQQRIEKLNKKKFLYLVAIELGLSSTSLQNIKG